MSFVDLGFWLAVPVILAGYYLAPMRWRSAYLLAMSLGYFALNSGLYVILLVASIGWTFAFGRFLARAGSEKRKQLLLLIGLVPVVGTLVLFKLGDALPGLIMPLGISYYTFKLIAYLVEIYWDETQEANSFVDFSAYVSFAPQLVSGPIQRPADFMEQISALRTGTNRQRIEDGFALLLEGLMLKLIIGDRLGTFVARVDANPASYTHAVIWVAALSMLPYLYADFAGYTKIALGLGRLFGIEGPPNFNAPFAAGNVLEYWRRWHMSLTSWLTDYVFMPLRMQTRAWGSAGLVFSIFVNMVLIGLWHGIAWTYLVFGLLQGLMLSVSALTLPRRDAFFAVHPALSGVRRVGGAATTFVLMSSAILVWFAPSLGTAWLQFKLVTGIAGAGHWGFDSMPVDIYAPAAAALAVSFYHGCGAPGFAWISGHCRLVFPVWVIEGVKLLLICGLAPEQGAAFIYGQF